jgi:hypothetical protein
MNYDTLKLRALSYKSMNYELQITSYDLQAMK